LFAEAPFVLPFTKTEEKGSGSLFIADLIVPDISVENPSKLNKYKNKLTKQKRNIVMNLKTKKAPILGKPSWGVLNEC
jgi:hypothetical protein